MMYIERWKAVLISLSCVLSLLYAAPNLLPAQTRAELAAHVPSWFPVNAVALGLDLRGGSHLLLQVDVETALKERLDDLSQSIRQQLRDDQEDKLAPPQMRIVDGGVVIEFVDEAALDSGRASIRKVEHGLLIDDGAAAHSLVVRYDEPTLREAKTQILAQSIEIVRRRVDESGTRESTIVRQGDDRILIQIPGLDNPARIKELLGRTAKLSFHLVDSEMSAGATSKLLPMQEDPTQKIAIKRRAILTGDMLTGAQPGFEQMGSPVVTFRLNSTGARRFCDVTRENAGQPFAIVLDDVVISAPRINEPICGGSAQISGHFTVQETADLSLLLRAGALPAALKVVEERTVGPSLGSDSVNAGKIAAIIGVVLVMINMMLAYGLFGVFAAATLVINMIMIIAVLSALGATLTLPGIAGIVLTIGMAVDANVLIFERVREELRAGKSVLGALEAGYARAFDTVIDSNLTTLIAALVLFLLGSGPIKGFAITLSIGILTSIYCAMMVTRLMVVTWVRTTRPTTLTV